MPEPLQNKELKSFFYKNNKERYSKCLWHTEDCKAPAVRAHAIQNSRALDKIAEDGHVMMVKTAATENTIHLKFDKIGRNIATTFTGLCSQHDSELFYPIDSQPVDISNSEHLFLIAYRSILKEFHANLQAANQVQSLYTKGLELGEYTEHGRQMLQATMQLVKSFHFYETVQRYRSIFVRRAWNDLTFISKTIKTVRPPLAATGVFLPVENEHAYNPEFPAYLTFNTFPQDDTLLLLFAWISKSHSGSFAEVDSLINAEGDHQLYLLSKFILKYTETFVFSTSTYETFSENQLNAVQKYFVANAMGNREEWEDQNLFLFGSSSD